MWDTILTLIIGALIPVALQWFGVIERKKYFNLNRKEKLREVAIEKRLEKHQEALIQWDNLTPTLHMDDNGNKHKIIEAARKFWISNCIYLEKETREKFFEAIGIARSYKIYLTNYYSMSPGKEKDDFKKFYLKCWDDFHKLPEIIQKEVELEPIRIEPGFTSEGIEVKN